MLGSEYSILDCVGVTREKGCVLQLFFNAITTRFTKCFCIVEIGKNEMELLCSCWMEFKAHGGCDIFDTELSNGWLYNTELFLNIWKQSLGELSLLLVTTSFLLCHLWLGGDNEVIHECLLEQSVYKYSKVFVLFQGDFTRGSSHRFNLKFHFSNPGGFVSSNNSSSSMYTNQLTGGEMYR